MKKKLLNGLYCVATLACLINCEPDPCVYSFYFQNSTNVNIDVVSLDEELGLISYFDTILIIPKATIINGGIGRDDSNYDSVPPFYYIDSIKVVYANQHEVIHYKDSTKGNYSHSIFNIASYKQGSCKYTYTFTQEDYEQSRLIVE